MCDTKSVRFQLFNIKILLKLILIQYLKYKQTLFCFYLDQTNVKYSYFGVYDYMMNRLTLLLFQYSGTWKTKNACNFFISQEINFSLIYLSKL